MTTTRYRTSGARAGRATGAARDSRDDTLSSAEPPAADDPPSVTPAPCRAADHPETPGGIPSRVPLARPV